MNKIIINEKEYEIPEINFSAVRRLEKLGVDFESAQEQPFSFISSLVALTIKSNNDVADNEIEQHLDKGGSINDFMPLMEAVANSSFFQKLAKKTRK